MFIIEKDGEQQAVGSLEGYGPEWTVLAQNVSAPDEFQEWDRERGRWRTNTARKAAAERIARYRTLDRSQLLELLVAFDERLASIEAKNAGSA